MKESLPKTYVGAPTPFIKLDNLTDHLGGAQIYAKVVSEANGGAHKIYNAVTLFNCSKGRSSTDCEIQAPVTLVKCYLWLQKNSVLNVKFWEPKILKDKT